MRSNLLSKKGRFKIGIQWIRQATGDLSRPPSSIEDVARALRDVLVLKCEMDWAEDCFKYVGVSHKFRALDKGEAIPNYVLTFVWDDESRIVNSYFTEVDDAN